MAENLIAMGEDDLYGPLGRTGPLSTRDLIEGRLLGTAGIGGNAKSAIARVPVPLALQQHYKPAEIARAWGVSEDMIVRLFREEPGVLRLGSPGTSGKRKYVTLRIPIAVLRRVHRRYRAPMAAASMPLFAAPLFSAHITAADRKRWRGKLVRRRKRDSSGRPGGWQQEEDHE